MLIVVDMLAFEGNYNASTLPRNLKVSLCICWFKYYTKAGNCSATLNVLEKTWT